jgi:hypothetical protein
MRCPPIRVGNLAQKPQRSRLLQRGPIALVAILTLCLLPFLVHALVKTKTPKTGTPDNQPTRLARLSETVSVHAAGRGNPTINLSDGHDVLTSYVGPEELRVALEQNVAEPLSLASADFDEDGVPDLVSGYAYNGQGIVTLLRGNVDSIYPNAPEAKQRKADGTFTDTPFLSPAEVFAAPVAADFIGAGDFDADGHWDIVLASRGGRALYLLSGDGHGRFAPTRLISLSGELTAFVTGEINRRDGLTDLVVGVVTENGPRILAFEGPEGALRAQPEVFDLPAPATSLALGQLDHEYAMDLAIAAGHELLVVHGRDRKLSLDESLRAKVPPAVTSGRVFDTQIKSIAIGHFTNGDGQSIAVLSDDGSVQLLSQLQEGKARAVVDNFAAWKSDFISSGDWSQAELVGAQVSSSARDDLVVMDASTRQLHILNNSTTLTESTSSESDVAAALDVAGAPVAVLPMRLNGDALSDLTVLTNGRTTPAVVMNQPEATIVVTNTNGSGPGSLQFAILDANETPGADLISFNIPGPGPFTIKPTNTLPTITDPVTIDGTTQPGFSGTPIIELTGTYQINALTITAGNSLVRGLTINRFGQPVVFKTNGGNIVEGCFIGTDVTGTRVFPDNLGVWVDGSFNNTIGGTTALAGNLITGNAQFGVQITDLGTTGGNVVQGNLIGTDRTGNSSLVSWGGQSGVLLANSFNDTIGGTIPGARNIISGNGSFGIRIICSGIDCQSAVGTGGTIIQGNFIGLNSAGNAALGNMGGGIQTSVVVNSVVIGGTVTTARNVISANRESGVYVSVSADSNIVQGNFIGTDASGSADLGNGGDGVDLLGASNTVGGTIAGGRNIISGNALSGVLIDSASGNAVQGNFIGTNAAGTAALGNDLNGVTTSQAPNNTIGGPTAAARNVISANGRHGVSIGIDTQSGSTGVTVRNNYIGTDLTGDNCLGNGRDGVFVNRGSVNHTITDNLITCNGRDGVNIPNFATNDPGIQIQVVQNSIYANAALGIDLGDAGITPNDAGDADTGANFLQNFPILTSVTGAANRDPVSPGDKEPKATVTVNGTLNSAPSTTFTVHWYFSVDAQCVTNQQTSKPLVTGKVPGVTTDINGNAAFNFPLDLPVGINSGIINCTATDPQGNTSEFSACLVVGSSPTPTPTPTPTPKTVQFSSASYSVSETGPRVDVSVTRSGDTTSSASVNFTTNDAAGLTNCNVFNSIASPRCDYTNTLGTLQWAAGDASSKSFSVAIVDDSYAEGTETFTVGLNSPSGATLGTQSTATVTITDNEAVNGANPIDNTNFFVRQQYIDFLGREPDPLGFAGWTGTINNCATDHPGHPEECDRIHVSQQFFQSAEFQDRGYFVYRFYDVAFGRKPDYSEFVPDLASVSGFLDATQLEAAKVAFVNGFMAKPAFVAAYNGLSNASFVNTLCATAGVTLGNQAALITALNNATLTRAQVLRQIVESGEVSAKYNHQAYAVMEYFGYLRRQPDAFYLDWITALDATNDPRGMVTGFATSQEYRSRFGP